MSRICRVQVIQLCAWVTSMDICEGFDGVYGRDLTS